MSIVSGHNQRLYQLTILNIDCAVGSAEAHAVGSTEARAVGIAEARAVGIAAAHAVGSAEAIDS